MKQYKKNSALAGAALAAFLIMTGCHHKRAAAPEPPEAPAAETAPAPTANITATPASVNPGQSTTLNWTTTNATDISIDGIGAGSRQRDQDGNSYRRRPPITWSRAETAARGRDGDGYRGAGPGAKHRRTAV